MRWSFSASVLLGVMLASISSWCQGAITPTQLRCEYLTNPLGIDVPQPRLTWVLESSDRGAKQTAYQIQAASSAELLKKGQADLWDSGKVKSDETIHIPYAGKPLASFQRVYWRVRVWDEKGRDSKYTPPAIWEMGLLDSVDWKAQWITAPKVESTSGAEPAPFFRKTVAVSKPIQSARAYICGLGYYELSLNGNKVSDHVLDPGYTQYNKRVLYVTHDVTHQLKQGENAIGVILGDGFYNQWVPDVWNFHKAPWRDRPRMIFQMHITYADGTQDVVVSDPTWKVTTGPIVQSTSRSGEWYDARLEMPGWDSAGYNDGAWKTAVAAEAPKGTLRAQMIEPMRVTQTIRPVKLTQPKNGVYIYDLGQNMTGWARIKVSGPAGVKLVMRFGERLKPDGTIDMSNLDPYVEKKLFQCDVYTLKGDAQETWEPRFTYHGFQYVQVESPIPLYLQSLQGRVVHTAFPKVGSFECSNPVINKLQRMTEWAYIGNFQCVPTDCPHREKNGWAGDAHLAAEAGMYNYDNAAGYADWIRSIKDAQSENGFVPDVIPDPKWTLNAGPAWESVYILLPWYMYQYNGDTRILAEHYEGMERLMKRLDSQAKDHILYNGLNDWVAIKPTKAEITVTSYYYLDAVIMSKTATLLGKEEDAKKYAELAEQIRQAYNKTLFDKATGLYRDGTQTAQLTPLYQGIANEEDRPAIFKGLMDALAKDKNHPTCGVFGAHFMPRVLTENGQIDLAFQMLTQPSGPGWGEWVAKGYTTLQENWGRGDSGNHIFFGNISAWFYNTLAGIRLDPEKPAWKHIVIKPHLAGDLTYAKAQTKTIRGTVASSWRKTEKGLALSVTIPPNTTGTVYVPAGEKAKITTVGKPISSQKVEGGYAKYEVDSGTYEFNVVNR